MDSETPRTGLVQGRLLALASAALFGASVPLCKLLLPASSPLMLAALLYGGAGIGLTLVRLGSRSGREAEIRRADRPLLAGVVLAGGVAGPVLMLFGLRRLSGVAGSLLINLEMPFTIVLAVLAFREHLGRREVASALLIAAGAVLLGSRPGELESDWLGAFAIMGACACWALDNNLTERLTVRDPIAVAQIKTLGASACSFVLAAATGGELPSARAALPALAIGSLSYGLSLILTMRALRLLGAARQAAYFATAPFAGAALSTVLLGDALRLVDGVAALFMASGVVLLTRERHAHRHRHEVMEHDHAHVHDEHHRHEHGGPVDEPHAHPHRHEAMEHEHEHVSDLHHRHSHGDAIRG